MDEQATSHQAKWLSSKIAGGKYRNADGSSRQALISVLQTYDQLTLLRDKANAFSSHAVKVLDSRGGELGFVPEPLCFEVSEALDSGGLAHAYVRHARQIGDMPWGAAIGVLWRKKLSARSEFRQVLDQLLKTQGEEWFWAVLSGLDKVNADGTPRQEIIAKLKYKESLQVRNDGGLDQLERSTKVYLEAGKEGIVAFLSKKHAETVLTRMREGRRWGAMVFEVRERKGKPGIEPVVALILFTEEFSATIREVENAEETG